MPGRRCPAWSPLPARLRAVERSPGCVRRPRSRPRAAVPPPEALATREQGPLRAATQGGREGLVSASRGFRLRGARVPAPRSRSRCSASTRVPPATCQPTLPRAPPPGEKVPLSRGQGSSPQHCAPGWERAAGGRWGGRTLVIEAEGTSTGAVLLQCAGTSRMMTRTARTGPQSIRTSAGGAAYRRGEGRADGGEPGRVRGPGNGPPPPAADRRRATVARCPPSAAGRAYSEPKLLISCCSVSDSSRGA